MDFTMLTLAPDSLHPAPDESFGSYVWRLATASGTTPRGVLRFGKILNTQNATLPTLLTRTMHVLLSPDQQWAFAHAFRLNPVQVSRLLLHQYAGTVFSAQALDRPRFASLHQALLQEWVQLNEMRYCPACLAETGVWQLPWHLAFTVACTKHAVLLNHLCPTCRQPACGGAVTSYARSTLDRIPQMTVCQNSDPQRDQARCGGELSVAPTHAIARAGPLMGAQETLNALLKGEAAALDAAGYTAPAFFHDLRQLCQLLIAAGQPSGPLGPLPEGVALAFQAHAAARDERQTWLHSHAHRLTSDGLLDRHLRVPAPADPRIVAAVLPLAMTVLLSSSRYGRRTLLHEILLAAPFWTAAAATLHWSAAF